MYISRRSKLNILLFLSAFLIGGILHCTSSASWWDAHQLQAWYGLFITMWGVSVHDRVRRGQNRRLLLSVAGMLLLLMLLQAARYSFFDGMEALRRVLWYAYYIPMLALPMLTFWLALCADGSLQDRRLGKWRLLVLPCAALMLAILTNDLHMLAFRTPGSPVVIDADGSYRHGPLFYLAYLWIGSLIAAAFAILIRRISGSPIRRYTWLAALPLAAGILYFALFDLLGTIRVGGVKPYNLAEVYGFLVILELEIFLQLGMLPTNNGYDLLFQETDLPMQILMQDGTVAFATKAPMPDVSDPGDQLLRTEPLDFGGSIRWAEDLSAVKRLTAEVAEAADMLAEELELLRSSQSVQREQAQYTQQNRMYDEIAEKVRRQSSALQELLSELQQSALQDAGSERVMLAEAALLISCIRRKSDLALRAGQAQVMETGALVSAVRETLEYCEFLGIEAVMSTFGQPQRLPAEMLLVVYDIFAAVLETALDTHTEGADQLGEHQDTGVSEPQCVNAGAWPFKALAVTLMTEEGELRACFKLIKTDLTDGTEKTPQLTAFLPTLQRFGAVITETNQTDSLTLELSLIC